MPGLLLRGWRGDRVVRFACEGEAEPWLYAIELADEAAAEGFARECEALLPGELPRPFTLERIGRRVVGSHALAPPLARGWAAALRARELRCLEPLECKE